MTRLLLLSAVVLGACDTSLEPIPAPCEPYPGPPLEVGYAPVDLPDSGLWYRGTGLQAFDGYAQDTDGVVRFAYDGREYYHPTQVAQKGLWFGDNYRRTGDSRFLARSEAHARRLIADAHRVDGALYFPFEFDYRLHGRHDQVMHAPWYGGMAQGQALSLFLRLHAWTGNERYRTAADSVMTSFFRLHGDGDAWTARVDCQGYYWIEEYPMVISTRTLNGFIFALFGVYEYWRATASEDAESLVRASLATLKRYLPEYRDPGNPSYYCLKHRAQYPSYHDFHIEQLEYVFRLSGDPFFRRMAETFARDYAHGAP